LGNFKTFPFDHSFLILFFFAQKLNMAWSLVNVVHSDLFVKSVHHSLDPHATDYFLEFMLFLDLYFFKCVLLCFKCLFEKFKSLFLFPSGLSFHDIVFIEGLHEKTCDEGEIEFSWESLKDSTVKFNFYIWQK
jgi:hypothetical protein